MTIRSRLSDLWHRLSDGRSQQPVRETVPEAPPERPALGVAASTRLELEVALSPAATPAQASAQHKRETVAELIASLPQDVERALRTAAQRRHDDEMVRILDQSGISDSQKVRILTHLHRAELQETLSCISWTRDRLYAFEFMLVRTLVDPDDPLLTSAPNILRNFFIHSELHRAEEKQPLRMGQFSSMIRTVFSGASTPEEIRRRIEQHITHGASPVLNVDERHAVERHVEEVSHRVGVRLLSAATRKQLLDPLLGDARREEDVERGTAWGGQFSPPQTYTFPHYAFQTGPSKGADTAVGRSSWEPLILAYADVLNARREQRLQRIDAAGGGRTMSGTDRIDLLYEPFAFPVDLRLGEDGVERPIVYIVDFIDLRRWHALEVKGPLTEVARAKIKRFRELYVDGDYAQIPQEQREVLVLYAEETLQMVRARCLELGFPTRERFSRFNVIGAFPWDWDLLAFNRHRLLKGHYSATVPPRLRKQFLEGTIQRIEQKIEHGDLPDIRPRRYTPTNDVLDLEQTSIRRARRSDQPFDVVSPVSTAPFLRQFIARAVSSSLEHEQRFDLERYVLDTLPFSEYERSVLRACDTLAHVFLGLVLALEGALESLSPTELARFRAGDSALAPANPFDASSARSSAATIVREIERPQSERTRALNQSTRDMLGMIASTALLEFGVLHAREFTHRTSEGSYVVTHDMMENGFAGFPGDTLTARLKSSHVILMTLTAVYRGEHERLYRRRFDEALEVLRDVRRVDPEKEIDFARNVLDKSPTIGRYTLGIVKEALQGIVRSRFGTMTPIYELFDCLHELRVSQRTPDYRSALSATARAVRTIFSHDATALSRAAALAVPPLSDGECKLLERAMRAVSPEATLTEADSALEQWSVAVLPDRLAEVLHAFVRLLEPARGDEIIREFESLLNAVWTPDRMRRFEPGLAPVIRGHGGGDAEDPSQKIVIIPGVGAVSPAELEEQAEDVRRTITAVRGRPRISE